LAAQISNAPPEVCLGQGASILNPTHATRPDHATFGKQILNIRSAHRKPMVSPNGVGDDFTWMTKALQARHCARYVHAPPYNQLSRAEQLGNAGENNLAMPEFPILTQSA
jgi:hypothetical protein